MGWDMSSSTFMPLRFLIFLLFAYIGMNLTTQAASEIRLSIPFVEFNPVNHKKKDILVDVSILSDPRIIDLASTVFLTINSLFHALLLKTFTCNLKQVMRG